MPKEPVNTAKETKPGIPIAPGSKESGQSAARYEMIATAAYLRAEQRGLQGGDPVADWLEAETEIDDASTMNT